MLRNTYNVGGSKEISIMEAYEKSNADGDSLSVRCEDSRSQVCNTSAKMSTHNSCMNPNLLRRHRRPMNQRWR